MKDITFRENFWEDIKTDARKHIHLVLIATKPDIIKQAPIYLELKKRGENVILCHTGQHYDFNLSGGLVEEFNLQPDFNLNIKGSLHKKVSQIIDRLGDVIEKMKEMDKVVIPYVHGDTMTAMAASNAAHAHEFASVHVEAGIRTLTPKKEIFEAIKNDFNWGNYYEKLQDRNNWERGSIEPYPEQFNTRATEPASGLHCASEELAKEFLLAEGCRPDRIKVTGNSVYDATMIAKKNAANSTIFETYPQLKDGFIRFCIHRRENCLNEKRFLVQLEAIEKLVASNESVLWILMNQTKSAIEKFGLEDRVEALRKKDNIILSDVWPFYTDVIAAMEYASVCVTDSGSMQEEMNIMSIPCVTLRFGSDRTETILAGANIIAPPTDSDLIVKIIMGAKNNEAMKTVPNIYGTDVSRKIVDEVLALLENNKLFSYEEDRLDM
jgi:UDP-N-acetylglucosamine 2-epimerase (non-hydrolysing)